MRQWFSPLHLIVAACTIVLVALAALAIMLAGTTEAGAETVTLSASGGTAEGMLSDALDEAGDGDIIRLTDGAFYEDDLVIDREVVVEGVGEVRLVATSVHVKASNVTLRSLLMYLDPGIMTMDGDGWTLDRVEMMECMGERCLASYWTSGGSIVSSTIIAANRDAVYLNGTTNVTVRDTLLFAPGMALRVEDGEGLDLHNLRVEDATFGIYLSWCHDVTLDHTAIDTNGWGLLLGNSSGITVRDTLITTSGSVFRNYGIYMAFGGDITVENCTFRDNAAGISLWETGAVHVSHNSIWENLEGVWSVSSDLHLKGNAIFGNLRYGLNATGGGGDATGNWWGTGHVSTALMEVRGDMGIAPVLTSDPTPDDPPVLLSPVPSRLTSVEDAASEAVYDVGAHLWDDTWYYTAYMPPPSPVRFSVIYNSDPANVTLRVGERSTCAGSCPVVEGEIKATTAANWYGSVNVQLRAFDWRGKTVDTNVFTIVFEPLNDRPVVVIDGLPKNSLLEVVAGGKELLNVGVHDDGPAVTLDVKLDDGEWERVWGGLACADDNSSRVRDLPVCTRRSVTYEVPNGLGPGRHVLAFRACDGELCSDEVYTGKYEVFLDVEKRADRGLNLEGIIIAMMMVVVLAAVAVAAGSGRKGRMGEEVEEGEERREGGGEEE